MFNLFAGFIFITIGYLVGSVIVFGFLVFYHKETFNDKISIPQTRFILISLSSWLGIIAMLGLCVSMAVAFAREKNENFNEDEKNRITKRRVL